MTELRPFDPAVSIFPLPMSVDRARHERRQAQRYGVRLPKGHPYRWLPTWVPYGFAQAISRIL